VDDLESLSIRHPGKKKPGLNHLSKPTRVGLETRESGLSELHARPEGWKINRQSKPIAGLTLELRLKWCDGSTERGLRINRIAQVGVPEVSIAEAEGTS
jgi:hypothetical protein